MKKGLFLLPLVGGLLLSGCTFTLFGKEISLFEKKNSNNNDNSNTSTDPTKPTVVDTTPSGSLLGTVTMTANTDKVSSSETEAVFTKGNCTVKVSQGSNTSNKVSDAVSGTGTYEFRVYAKFALEFSATTAFKQVLVKYSSYKQASGTTYYFDFDSLTGATCVHDDTKYEALVTLDAAATSYSFEPYHQVRIATVAFYA